MINFEKKIIYVRIPKTASTSICSYITEGRHPAHQTAYHIKNFIERETDLTFDDFFKFTFIRNPHDRAVSIYHFFKEWWELTDFESFIKDIPTLRSDGFKSHILKQQYDYIFDNEGNKLLNFIGRFETIEKDWKLIFNKAELPHLKKSSEREHYLTYYTPELYDLVSGYYNKDIEHFYGSNI